MKRILYACVALLLFANTWAQESIPEAALPSTPKSVKRTYVRLFASETSGFYSGANDTEMKDYRNYSPGVRLGVQVGTKLVGCWYFDAGVNVSYSNWNRKLNLSDPLEVSSVWLTNPNPNDNEKWRYAGILTTKSHEQEYKWNIHQIALNIPLNFSWKIKCGKFVSVEPFVGMHFKFNLMNKQYGRLTDTDNLSTTINKFDESIQLISSSVSEAKEKTELKENINLLSKEDMGSEVFRRFLVGWQTGVGVNIHRLYLGLEYQANYSLLRSTNPNYSVNNFDTHVVAFNIGVNF